MPVPHGYNSLQFDGGKGGVIWRGEKGSEGWQGGIRRGGLGARESRKGGVERGAVKGREKDGELYGNVSSFKVVWWSLQGGPFPPSVTSW